MFAKELALNLEININTLRRWAIELEKEGYIFSRNDKKQRIYYERDILVLSKFRKIIEKTQSLENTAKAVVSSINDKDNAEEMLSVIKENNGKIVLSKEDLESLLDRVAMEAVNRTAEQLSKSFLDVLEQRDKNLLHNLTKTMEQERLEVFAIAEGKKSRSFFHIFKRLFNNPTK